VVNHIRTFHSQRANVKIMRRGIESYNAGDENNMTGEQYIKMNEKEKLNTLMRSTAGVGKTVKSLRDVIEQSKRTGDKFTCPAIRNHWIRVVDGSIECSDQSIKTLADLLIRVLGHDTDWQFVPDNSRATRSWAETWLLSKGNTNPNTNTFGII
jgi:hypothetical protein